MYERGYAKVDILELFRVIDWILRLPSALEHEFLKELQTYEKVHQMPYITSIERIGIQKGILRRESALLLRLIELRFGAASEAVIRQVREADADTLLQWSERILTAETLSDVMKPNT